MVLLDGSFFSGKSFGANSSSSGELVFNTSMTGYQESLTDPSYSGQILTFSYPLIGNYGISKEAWESSKVHPAGVVVREWCENPVHRESVSNLHEFLQEHGVSGICGVDTRAVVEKIRTAGVMPASIVPFDSSSKESAMDAVESALSKLRSFDYGSIDFVKKVSRGQAEEFLPDSPALFHIVLVDCGVKQNIIRELVRRKCKVTVVPAWTASSQILGLKPDGVLYSNGPGDPSLMSYAIASCREVLGKVPVFGICLGHQILGHALGARTYKLPFGHRGSNHAVLDRFTGKTYVTSQNHGYAVTALPKQAWEWLSNVNDSSSEGIICEEMNAFSVQFHPEACPGPLDTDFLFDKFLSMLK